MSYHPHRVGNGESEGEMIRVIKSLFVASAMIAVGFTSLNLDNPHWVYGAYYLLALATVVIFLLAMEGFK